MADIKAKVLAITEKALRERLDKEAEEARQQADKDAKVVERAVELIQQNLMYKEVSEGYFRHYVFATEEMFFEDFIKKPKYEWQAGIKFDDNSTSHDYEKGAFVVNGEKYYDIRYLLHKYVADVKALKNRITQYEGDLSDIIKDFDRMIEQRPMIKRLLEESPYGGMTEDA